MNDMIPLDTGGLRPEIPASALLDALGSHFKSRPVKPSHQVKIGEYLPGQGGIYAGDILGDYGTVYGLVVAEDDLDGAYTWGPEDGELINSTWDGQANTIALDILHALDRPPHPAASAVRQFSADGHADFYLPAKREMQIIAANLPHLFLLPKVYWTSTLYGSCHAWAVSFECGDVFYWFRDCEFRVRPVRRINY